MLVSCCPNALAGAVTDGTAGPVQTFTGQFVVPQDAGTLVGNNLFHSFKSFNIEPGESATFTSSTSTVEHVISRVTGGQASVIHGLLRLQAAGGGRPSFFLINPAGVTFGQGAQVDVPGAFHVSTAHQLRFSDDFILDARSASGSTFTSAAPASFGFLGDAAAAIVLHNRNAAGVAGAAVALTAKTGGAMTLIGGSLEVTNVSLSASEGRLVAVATGMQPTSVTMDGASSVAQLGAVAFNGARMATSGSGSIVLAGGTIELLNSQITSTEGSASAAGSITVRSTGAITLNNTVISSNTQAANLGAGISLESGGHVRLMKSGQIASNATSTQSGGDISVQAASLSVDDTDAVGPLTGILTRNSPGLTGRIHIDVDGTIQVLNAAQVRTIGSAADGGDSIRVRAGSIVLDNRPRPQFFTGLITRSSATADAGGISVKVRDNLTILDTATIASTTATSRNTGPIEVQAGALTIDGSALAPGLLQGGGILASSFPGSAGGIGAITVDVSGEARLVKGGVITSTAYFAGSGSAPGDIEVTAGSITIDADSGRYAGQGTGIYSATFTAADAGRLSVTVSKGDLQVLGGGQLLSSTLGQGAAGPIAINVEQGSLVIDSRGVTGGVQSGIYSRSEDGATGDAGRIGVRVAKDIMLLGAARISSSTLSTGTAGAIDLEAQGLLLDAGGGILSQTMPGTQLDVTYGDAGAINVSIADLLSIRRGSLISSTTSTSGTGGSVQIRAGTLEIAGTGSQISAGASSQSSGQPGSVKVAASESILLSEGGTLSIRNDAHTPDPGSLSRTVLAVSAPSIALRDASITAESTGNVAASDIEVTFGERMVVDPSRIATSATAGDGGHITIRGGGLLWLDRSQITTSVLGSSGNGGDISISTDMLLLETGFIQANTAAPQALGGSVSINVNALLASGPLLLGSETPLVFDPALAGINVIQAAAPDGVSGHIRMATPALDIAGDLSRVTTQISDPVPLTGDLCRRGSGSSLTPIGRGALRPTAIGLIRPERVLRVAGGPPALRQARVTEPRVFTVATD